MEKQEEKDPLSEMLEYKKRFVKENNFALTKDGVPTTDSARKHEMSMEITITKGNAEDIEAIARFQVDMAMETEGMQLDFATVTKGVSAAMSDGNKGCYYVAKADGETVGSLMLTREWSDWRNGWYWWIQSVYVVPRLRRCGIYRAMYQTVCAEAREQNVPQVRLYVDRTNTRGQSVYESFGMHQSHYLIYEN